MKQHDQIIITAKEAKQAFQFLIESDLSKFDEWTKDISFSNPAKAFNEVVTRILKSKKYGNR